MFLVTGMLVIKLFCAGLGGAHKRLSRHPSFSPPVPVPSSLLLAAPAMSFKLTKGMSPF